MRVRYYIRQFWAPTGPLLRLLTAGQVNAGVIIHIHGILHSFEYPAEWVLQERRSRNEICLIRAFLQFNMVFQVLMWNTKEGVCG